MYTNSSNWRVAIKYTNWSFICVFISAPLTSNWNWNWSWNAIYWNQYITYTKRFCTMYN